jgi:hypothetical protein
MRGTGGRLARTLGPLALAACAPADLTDHRDAAVAAGATIDPAAFEADLAVLAADDMAGRDNLTPGGERARDWLRDRLSTLGLEPSGTDGFDQPFADGVNLIARIPGTDLADEVVVLGAHYDHLGTSTDPGSGCVALDGDTICNGAADNAAGVVATLRIAEAVLAADLRPRRTLLVALWDAEEDGLLGSRHFVDDEPLVDLDDVVAAFSTDQIGTRMVPGAELGLALGVDHATVLRELIHADDATLGTSVYPVSLTFDGNGGRSDHKPFHDAGVPVIFFGSGSTPTYHTPADEVDTVDADLAVMLARQVLLAAWDLAARDDRPVHLAEHQPSLDDAIALRDLGRLVLADPAAVGLDDPTVIAVLEGWMAQLEAYVATPPATPAAWADYDAFVQQILAAVYAFLG